MDQNDKRIETVTVYGLHRSTVASEKKDMMGVQSQSRRQIIVLDPQRPGDRRQLARLLAAIAWRLAKEQAEQDVVLSQEQPESTPIRD